MRDEDEHKGSDEESDEEESSDEEELSNLEKWKRAYLRRVAEKAAKKFEKSGGRKVDKGFEDAFGGQENAHKYYRHHKDFFKYKAEPKEKIPQSKPLGKPPEYFTEPSKWIPPKPTENQPRKDTTETLQIPEKPIIEHGRREAEGAGTDGKDKDDFRKADALHHDDLAIEKTQNDNPTELVTTLDIETPAKSAHDITSQITSRMEDGGYEHVSTETDPADYTFEPSFLEDDLEKIEMMAREDSISPLELSETHEALRQEEIENILEEQRQELLQDFEIEPPFHGDIAGLEVATPVAESLPEPLDTPFRSRHELADAEIEGE